jgi:hypothetical protein
MGSRLFPNVFAPSALCGLPPSWSGVFARIISPPRTIERPLYGTYKKITVLSRDEERRVTVHNFQKMIDKYPPGSYQEVSISEYREAQGIIKKSDHT